MKVLCSGMLTEDREALQTTGEGLWIPWEGPVTLHFLVELFPNSPPPVAASDKESRLPRTTLSRAPSLSNNFRPKFQNLSRAGAAHD